MIRLLAAIVAVVAAALAVVYLGFDTTPSFMRETLALLAVSTVGLSYYLVQMKEHRPEIFTQFYMATQILKILAFGAYVFVMFWLDPVGAVDNAIFFLVLYVIFTALEVLFVYRKITR